MEVVEHGPNSKGQVQEFSIASNMGTLVLNWDRTWDFFIVVGGSSFFQRTPFTDTGTGLKTMIEMRYPAAACWGIGWRGTLWEYHGLGVGCEAEYFEVRPTLGSFFFYDDGLTSYPIKPAASKYVDWQFALGPSYTIHTCHGTSFSPYIAWKYSRAFFNQKNPRFDLANGSLIQGNLISARQNGYAVGMSAIFSELAGATIEARFVGDSALFVSAEMRF